MSSRITFYIGLLEEIMHNYPNVSLLKFCPRGCQGRDLIERPTLDFVHTDKQEEDNVGLSFLQ